MEPRRVLGTDCWDVNGTPEGIGSQVFYGAEIGPQMGLGVIEDGLCAGCVWKGVSCGTVVKRAVRLL
jgi:hypothetical protein